MGGRRLFLILFFGLGLWALVTAAVKTTEGIRAYSWPLAEGRIILSGVKEFHTAQNIRVARLCLDLDYLYLAGREVYEGHRLNVGWNCFGTEAWAKGVIDRYPQGAKVLVYYNPDNPHQAVLEPGLDWSVVFLWGVALVLLSAVWPVYRRALAGNRWREKSF